jgi:hypothetical protein
LHLPVRNYIAIVLASGPLLLSPAIVCAQFVQQGPKLTTGNETWGGSSDQPVKGDYDGDGKADFAVYVSNTGMWYILLSGANYSTSIVRAWGGSGWVALPQSP